MSLSFWCAHPLPSVIVRLYLGPEALRGYREHEAEFHPITSGYMTLTVNLSERQTGGNQSETSWDRCMKMACVTFYVADSVISAFD